MSYAYADRITPFIVMDVLERAQELEAEGRDIIHLEVGEPDFDTPSQINAAATRAMEEGDTHYTGSLGTLALRQTIVDYYRDRYDVTLAPEQILVTSGSSPALLLVFSALVEPGDEVVFGDPHYACYPNVIKYLGGVCRTVPLCEEDGFQLHPAAVRETLGRRTRAVLINSPANPTGTVLEPAHMREIAALPTTIVSDEIYHGLTYGVQAHSILEYRPDAVVVSGFSKLFAMTGWRLGYIIGPAAFIDALRRMHQNFFICAPSFAQAAARVALTQCDADTERMVATYDRRRRVLIDGLRSVGLSVAVEPQGAFYVLANARKYSEDSYRLAFDILEKAGVACTPGIDFGAGAEGYLRFTYANSEENIRRAVERLREYFEEHPTG